MKYLLHVNLAKEQSYASDYTLLGVFDTKQECLDYITGYNSRVETFKAENKDLIKKAGRHVADDPKYKEITSKFDFALTESKLISNRRYKYE